MVEQFDIYWVDLNPTVGAEIQKVRPCVVVSPKELNRYLATSSLSLLRQLSMVILSGFVVALQSVMVRLSQIRLELLTGVD